MSARVDANLVTGLILAGGQGSRLGGVDKGLLSYRGVPLARHALTRLRPQVGRVMISANRHLETYRAMGAPVWPDTESSVPFDGPLAGFLAGLAHCESSCMVSVPCDCPNFPPDLVERLMAAMAGENAEIAVAATRHGQDVKLEPAFCLMKRELAGSLKAYLATGQRKIERWTSQHRRAEVVFEDAAAFFNINTPDDLSNV